MNVRDAALGGMIAVKGDLGDEALRGAVVEAAGVKFPGDGEASVSGRQGVLWMAPDEVLVLVDAARRAEALGGLRMAAGRHVLVENVSDMRTGFVLEGPEVRDVLARVTPADVSPAALPPGRVRRTRVGQVAAAIWLAEEEVAEVLCFRSVAAYVRELLEQACASGSLGLYHVVHGA